jgi:putative sugar O-methyltransferase
MTESNWMVKGSALENYLKVCKQAALDDKVFKTFKSDPDYRKILEHASRKLGESYLKSIKKNNPYILDHIGDFLQADTIGSPKTETFGSITCSPTTLQYMGVLATLTRLYGDMSGWKVAEIGGGYGGQCMIIQEWCGTLKGYDIIDLYECTLLQNRYLNHFKRKFKTYTPEDYPKKKKYDLVISNYALSEVMEPLQTRYIEDILLNSKHGYITCNVPLKSMELLRNKFTIAISPDIEGERNTNFIITW